VVIVKVDGRSVPFTTRQRRASLLSQGGAKTLFRLRAGAEADAALRKKSPDETLTLGGLANKSPSLFQRQVLLFVL
jgi:ATP-binding cassette subfamily B protein RaxB